MGNARDQHQRISEILLSIASSHESCRDHSLHTRANRYRSHGKKVFVKLWIVLVQLREKKRKISKPKPDEHDFENEYLCPISAKNKIQKQWVGITIWRKYHQKWKLPAMCSFHHRFRHLCLKTLRQSCENYSHRIDSRQIDSLGSSCRLRRHLCTMNKRKFRS